MAEYTALAPLFTDIANAIRSKTGETGAITANSFPDLIRTLQPPTPPISNILNDNTWSQIRDVTDKGLQANYWAVGDVKMDKIDGTFGDTVVNNTYGFFILDLVHRPNEEGLGIVFGGFKTDKSGGTDIAICASNYGYNNQTVGFLMNQSNTSSNGWRDSYMRNTIIPQFIVSLSTDLQKNIRTSTIWSHNKPGGSANDNSNWVTATSDKVYLLAEFEIFGVRTFANSYERYNQAQMTYYKNGNSKVKYRHSVTSSAVNWWGRSANCSSSTNTAFCYVYGDGTENISLPNYSYGFAPCFRL